jgi:hypothetical protein
VAGIRIGLAAGSADRVGHRLAAVDLPARDEYVRAVFGEAAGDGCADTATRAGDQGDAAIELEMIA